MIATLLGALTLTGVGAYLLARLFALLLPHRAGPRAAAAAEAPGRRVSLSWTWPAAPEVSR